MCSCILYHVTRGSAALNSYLKAGWQGAEAGCTQGSAVGTAEARAEGEAGGVGGGADVGLSRGAGKPPVSWRWWGGADRCVGARGWGQSAWEGLLGSNTQHQEKNWRPSTAIWKNPPGSIGLRKPGLTTATHPKEEKVRLLCSVLSPKPRSDFKNRKLTPTILTTRRHLNNLKPGLCLLPTAPLRDSPCFLCWLHLPSTA